MAYFMPTKPQNILLGEGRREWNWLWGELDRTWWLRAQAEQGSFTKCLLLHVLGIQILALIY